MDKAIPKARPKAKLTKSKGKGSITKAQQGSNTPLDMLIPCMFYPNSKKGEIDVCNMVLNDKIMSFKANTMQKVKLANISNMADSVKLLFAMLKPNNGKFHFAYRNTFWSFGVSDKQSKSFKACIAYFAHKGNQICINANRHFSFADIVQKLNKAKVTFTPYKTYAMVTITDSNTKSIATVCNELVA